ncbi:MAG: nuclear transport factor 2 family protein [Bacteroidia bacterium]|nr:nuclear transport factor 2 family protein [Bacteroidia bacterium]
MNNDTVSHSTIVYKDFICIAGNGAVINRDDYMKGWAHGYDALLYKSFVMRNELIRIMGNTALVRAETFYTYTDNGKEVSGTTVYTDTYIKLDGRWWCIQAQLTPKN